MSLGDADHRPSLNPARPNPSGEAELGALAPSLTRDGAGASPFGARSLTVVALGGNALEPPRDLRTTAPPSALEHRARVWATVRETALHLAELAATGDRLLVTHGNGPQVGDELTRSELAAGSVSPLGLDLAVASTQGSIGYQLARALGDALGAARSDRPVVTLVTQVLVDRHDPAFKHPTKPIGPFIHQVHAERMARTRGWHVRDFGAKGWRRVVASPLPLAVLEESSISRLLDAGVIVIAGGGGGIPVSRQTAGPDPAAKRNNALTNNVDADAPEEPTQPSLPTLQLPPLPALPPELNPPPHALVGVAAVIDKDLLSSLLARSLGATHLIIATGVAQVQIGFGTPHAKALDTMTLDEAEAYLAAGEFPPGTMGPKVRAMAEFVRAGGQHAVITSLEQIAPAWRGAAGTRLVAARPAV